jgi:hypothetical protein
MTGSRSAVAAFSARACACLAVTFFAGSLGSGELARLARGFRTVVRVFGISATAVGLLGAFARTAFILGGGLGGGTGVFARLDALVAVAPIFDLVAILLRRSLLSGGKLQDKLELTRK